MKLNTNEVTRKKFLSSPIPKLPYNSETSRLPSTKFCETVCIETPECIFIIGWARTGYNPNAHDSDLGTTKLECKDRSLLNKKGYKWQSYKYETKEELRDYIFNFQKSVQAKRQENETQTLD